MARPPRSHRKKLTALLDAYRPGQGTAKNTAAAAGLQPTALDTIAMRACSLLANGMGGVDWSGFDLACEYLGVQDPADLIHRIEIIKHHAAAEASVTPDTTPDTPTTAPEDHAA